MTRFGSFVLCATLASGLLACSSSSGDNTGGNGGGGNGGGGNGGGNSSKPAVSNALDLVPLDNTVQGWTVDKDSNKGGTADPMTAFSKDEGGNLIDGGIEPFYSGSFAPKEFVWQNYQNSSLPAAPPDPKNGMPKGATIVLYVFQMPSADQASGLYKKLLDFSEYSRKSGTSEDWQEPTEPRLGTDSRIQDTGSQWWINFYKGAFYIEVMLSPSNGPAPDFEPSDPDLKQAAMDFAGAIASKL